MQLKSPANINTPVSSSDSQSPKNQKKPSKPTKSTEPIKSFKFTYITEELPEKASVQIYYVANIFDNWNKLKEKFLSYRERFPHQEKTQFNILLKTINTANIYYLTLTKSFFHPDYYPESLKKFEETQKKSYDEDKQISYEQIMKSTFFERNLRQVPDFADLQSRKQILRIIYELGFDADKKQKINKFYFVLLRRMQEFVFNILSKNEKNQLPFAVFSFLCIYLQCFTYFPSYFELCLSQFQISRSIFSFMVQREGSRKLLREVTRINPRFIRIQIQIVKTILAK